MSLCICPRFRVSGDGNTWGDNGHIIQCEADDPNSKVEFILMPASETDEGRARVQAFLDGLGVPEEDVLSRLSSFWLVKLNGDQQGAAYEATPRHTENPVFASVGPNRTVRAV